MSSRQRVLVVDSEPQLSTGGSFYRGFQALGHDAIFFDQTPWLGGWSKATRLTKGLRRVTRPLAAPAMNLALLTTVLARKPDVVLVMKGFHVLPETIVAMRRAARTIVSYHSDDLENPGNTSKAMRASLPLWDVLFTPRTFVEQELKARGVRRVSPLPFAYEPRLFHPESTSSLPEQGLEDSLVFVGSWAPDRPEQLERLHRRFPLRVWGNGWGNVPTTSPLSPALRRKQLLGPALRAVLNHGAINLGFLRKANRDRHTTRTFEIPACGGFLLAERTEDHQRFFEEGREAVFYSSPEEMEEHCARYLADPTSRRRIADAGYRRLVASGYRYQDRAAEMLRVVAELT